jgi:hypothetical protein
MCEWIGSSDAAKLLQVARNTVYLSLKDESRRQNTWGDEGEGWRYKPLSDRKIFQLNKKLVEQLSGKKLEPS